MKTVYENEDNFGFDAENKHCNFNYKEFYEMYWFF